MAYIWKELVRHKWRTIAGMAGYALATLFIVVLVSVNLSGTRDSFGILKGTGTHFIVYIPSNTSCCTSTCEQPVTGGALVAEGVFTLMMNSDLLYSIRNIEGVREAAPYLLYRLFDKRLNCEVSLGGIDTTSLATKTNVCAKTNIIEGKFMSDRPDEVVAEESFAMAHKLSVGDTLDTYGGRLVIAGIINSGIKPGKADLYAPIENVRSILRDKLQCISPGFDMNIVLVEVRDARIQPRVMKEIREKMNYLSLSSYNCYQPATDVMSILSQSTSVLSVIIFIFLLIFSAKTQLTALMERFREIGILKSLGWSDRALSYQIFAMSVIQALTGAVAGVVLGMIVVNLLNLNSVRLFDMMEFRLNATSPLFMIILSLAGGLIAAVFPVIKLRRTKAGEMINNFM